MNGRPLRFLGVVVGGWALLRIAALWPHQSLPVPTMDAGVPVALRRAAPPAAPPRNAPEPVQRPLVRMAARAPDQGALVSRPRAPISSVGRARAGADPDRLALALLALVRVGPAQMVAASPLRDVAAAPPLLGARALAPGASRWSGSAWLVARGGSGLGQSPFAGQLGGSQAGVRLAYALGASRRVAIVARAATPLSTPGSEAAIGIEWRPGRAPIRLIAEQRIGIDPGTGGPAVGILGGIGPTALATFRLEAYGQAGVIARGGAIGYADGSVRVDHVIARHRGVIVSAGGALWGAAQPGAARLDAGPVLSLSVPVAKQRVRLSLEWRARISGQAAPGSGPALSLGGDF